MGSTTIFGFFYPDDTTPNDLHTHLQMLATGIETEMSRQGRLEDRPEAGVQGRLYWATTRVDPYGSSVVAWNVLYRDDGTTWQQLNDSAIQTYQPVWSLEPGAGFSMSLYGGAAANAEYQIKVNGKCWLNINQLLTLTGTTGTQAVWAGLPVNAASFAGAAATAQNRPPEVSVNPDHDVMEFHSGDYSAGQNWQFGAPFWFRATAEYRIG